jgi:hypothetical protein
MGSAPDGFAIDGSDRHQRQQVQEKAEEYDHGRKCRDRDFKEEKSGHDRSGRDGLYDPKEIHEEIQECREHGCGGGHDGEEIHEGEEGGGRG